MGGSVQIGCGWAAAASQCGVEMGGERISRGRVLGGRQVIPMSDGV